MNDKLKFQTKSIRPFIGAKNYSVSREFYRKIGFEENVLDEKMCYFRISENLGFYLQDAYVAEWVDNSMVFLEVDDIEICAKELLDKDLPSQYELVRLSEIKTFEHGRELFMHDPSGVLWHFCQFNEDA